MLNNRYPFDYVIFDFDGTLFDTAPAIAFCLKKLFEQFHYDTSQIDQVLHHALAKGINLQEIISLLLPTFNLEQIDQLLVDYRIIYRRDWMQHGRIFVGVDKIFQFLAQHAVKIIVVSNKGEAAIEQALSAHQLLTYVDCIVGDRAGLNVKPSRDIYDKVIQHYFPAIVNDRTLMVGDSVADIQFARNVGMPFCWAKYGYGNAQQIYPLQPDYVIDQLAEMFQIGNKQQRR